MSVETGTGQLRALSELIRLERPVLQRMELAAPWSTRVDGCDHPGMYAVHRGAAHIDVFDETVRLEVGDVLLLPRGGGKHVVRDVFGTSPLTADELADRTERRDEQLVELRGTGPRTLMSGVPFASAPLAWLPRALVVRRREQDPLTRSLFAAYEQALDHGDAPVVARIAEALWVRSVAESVPHVHRFDVDVLRVAARVLEDPSASHTLPALARAACLSRSRFSARFTSTFGEPPMRWVQRVRIEHAERLLREGSMSVAAVADLLGFSDESAFRKAYRRIVGTPPRGHAR